MVFSRLFVAGLISVILGYLALAMGSMTFAPLLLVLGYCLLIPWALFKLGRTENGGSGGSAGGE
ncbi:MAG: hypothetical protein QGG80_02000 [Candidatus Krumholzibacteria bacterium]|jgi:hypothetical protein|nr:hypothetical protein [Candidatus Krumholzibacteria bacterium]MDP6796660.1 hypothetical protein [Candidatus Krumholzibacteria bacterium]MDP7021286.1 hypothetical protein [Candidatus Krumholzibacteria bacterium]